MNGYFKKALKDAERAAKKRADDEAKALIERDRIAKEARERAAEKQRVPELSDTEVLAQPSSSYPQLAIDDETLGRFFAEGQFTPERQRLHDAILRKV